MASGASERKTQNKRGQETQWGGLGRGDMQVKGRKERQNTIDNTWYDECSPTLVGVKGKHRFFNLNNLFLM